MEILIITTAPIPIGLGDTRRVMEMANYLYKEGHIIHIFSYNINGIEERFLLKNVNPLYLKKNLRKYVLENDIKFVIAHPQLNATIAITSCKGIVPVAADFHDPLITRFYDMDAIGYKFNHAVMRQFIDIEEFVIKKSDFVLCTSPRVKRWLYKMGRTPQRTEVVLNGVPENFFDVKKERRYGENPVAIFVGAMEYFFDFDTLIKAMKLVIRRNKEIKFVFMGRGPSRNFIKLLAYFHRKQIIVEKWIENSEVPNHIISGDIGIHSVGKHAHGYYACHMKTFEYMSLGLPVVGTDIDYSMEIAKKAKACIPITPNNPKKFANEILNIIGNPDKLKKMGNNGREYAKKFLGWSQVVKKLDKVLAKFE